MKTILKARQAEILKCLIVSGAPLDVEYFKEKFDKGDRTIRYDIQELKKACLTQGVELSYQTKKGFYIPSEQKSKASGLLALTEEKSPASDEEKRRFDKIFWYLFLQKDYVTAERIAERLYVSYSTLKRLLDRMEDHYRNAFLLESRKSLGYRLTGDEFSLRMCAARLLSAEFKGSYRAENWFMLLPEQLKGSMKLNDLEQITKTIKGLNAKYNIWISNAAFLNLLSYCIVRRIRLDGKRDQEKEDEKKQPEHVMTETYAREFLKAFSVSYKEQNPSEQKWLIQVLTDNGIYAGTGLVEDVIVDHCLERVMSHLEKRTEKYHFKLEALQKDLREHIRNFLNLCASGTKTEENSYILQEVKEHYSEVFGLAKECARVLEEATGYQVNLTEVCYLAVYLYKNSEQKEVEKKNILVVCATGKGLSQLLTLRINSVFPQLNVVGQISPYQLSKASELKGVDFVISTIPLENDLVPVVKISSILSEEDIKRIRSFLKYGQLVDEIPMNQKNEASFSAGKDILFLPEQKDEIQKESMIQAASVLSRLILTLLEYTSGFPTEFAMSKDAALGMIIHMSMAVTRWMEGQIQTEDEDFFLDEYKRIRESYPDVYMLMEKFFALAEETLKVIIPVSERTAFFLYILEKE